MATCSGFDLSAFRTDHAKRSFNPLYDQIHEVLTVLCSNWGKTNIKQWKRSGEKLLELSPQQIKPVQYGKRVICKSRLRVFIENSIHSIRLKNFKKIFSRRHDGPVNG